MAQGSNYKVAFRRRREGKTDYGARINLIDYEKSRLVVRVSNTQATVQIVDYTPEGDITVASAVGKQLSNYGYLGNTGNITGTTFVSECC